MLPEYGNFITLAKLLKKYEFKRVVRPQPTIEYCFGPSKLILGNSLKKKSWKTCLNYPNEYCFEYSNQIVWNSLENHKISLQQPWVVDSL